MRPERFRRLRAALERRQPDLTVFMDRVHKPHNFSAILRSCDAVGVLEAHVVVPEGPVRLHRATSGGTAKWIRVHRHSAAAEAVERLRAEGFRLVAADPGAGAVDYLEADYTVPTAFVVGAELHGVSEETLAAADVRVRLPMEGMARSLNVSVATALLLYEARRQRRAAEGFEGRRLTPDDFADRLFEWCYPTRARELRADGRPFPRLGASGEIIDAT